ncbi:probable membrane-associated kinase regulator 6 isoform X2 [Citrus sinensis]|uniref:probable membrane-associated kinase regulator 6 isoform X2 n=1 Tax=Citrus sinensis TaxID=2711 RepID=UPI0003D77F91|nr:probable membrane-associated kinase regulator 6 isoform X2 [Citrus sinensis]XP_052294921.1 probable membrane-associated kinase regulator 6 isoform X2 [Citrus sinensis]
METSSPLAIESFSYSWLSNVETLLDGIDEPLRTSLDSSSEAISKELAENFNFDIPTSQSSAALLHADELFSDGLIKPEFVDPSKILDASTSDLTAIISEAHGKGVVGLMILTGENGKLRVRAVHHKHLHHQVQNIQWVWVIGMILRTQFMKRFSIAKDQ